MPVSDRVLMRDRDGLTAREIEVLTVLATGKGNADMGRDLYIAEQTVKYHLTNIYRKLGVTTRTEAVALAINRGMIWAEKRECPCCGSERVDPIVIINGVQYVRQGA